MKITDLYTVERGTVEGSVVLSCGECFHIETHFYDPGDVTQRFEKHVRDEHLAPSNVGGGYYDLPLPKASWFRVIPTTTVHTMGDGSNPVQLFKVDCRKCSLFSEHGSPEVLHDILSKHAALHLIESFAADHVVPTGTHLELKHYKGRGYICCDTCDHKRGFTPLPFYDYTNLWANAMYSHLLTHPVADQKGTTAMDTISVMEELAKTGHGHVVPRNDGKRARCMGIGGCPQCSIDKARLDQAREAEGNVHPIDAPTVVEPPAETTFVQNDAVVIVVQHNQSPVEDAFMKWVTNVPSPLRRYIIGPLKMHNDWHTYAFLPTGMSGSDEFTTNADRFRDEFINLFTVMDVADESMGVRVKWPWSPDKPTGAVKWMRPDTDNN